MDYQWPRNPSYAWRFSVTGGTNAGIYWCHHRDISPSAVAISWHSPVSMLQEATPLEPGEFR